MENRAQGKKRGEKIEMLRGEDKRREMLGEGGEGGNGRVRGELEGGGVLFHIAFDPVFEVGYVSVYREELRVTLSLVVPEAHQP